ncbi:MAG: reverse transcriptase-like protein [Candidatus Nitrosocosmicus sp.]|nr:reverse transcriptase-like protein [Candidatus Nitrosocosmicus sp.]
MRNIHIAIDVDGSPSGYISWHNHFQNKSKIRTLKPYKKNERFGVQRMEMLAVYFAISDNLKTIRKKLKRKGKKKIIVIRSDSKSTIEQLNRRSKVKDDIIKRIYNSIIRIMEKVSCVLVFYYLRRNNNKAGKLLEILRKENKLREHTTLLNHVIIE